MGPNALWWMGPAALALGAASAVLSAVETAFFALQPLHVERLKLRRADFAAALENLMENPRRLLNAILLADLLVNLPLIFLCLGFFRAGFTSPAPLWIPILLIFTVIVFFCDLAPKILALADPYTFTRIGVRLMGALLPALGPIAGLLEETGERLVEKLAPRAWKEGRMERRKSWGSLVELSAEEGALHPAESEILQEIIKLSDKTVRDCMTPRVDMFALPDDLTNEEVVPMLRARRQRRAPVYGETPDEILGVLDVTSFLLADQKAHYTLNLAAPSFVPETMKALDLLRSFLTHPQTIAIVVDEHGGTEGIITMADFIEELISDALPAADRDLYIEPLEGGRLIVHGSARLEDINETLGVGLEEEGIDTISGFIFHRAGDLPAPGAELRVDGLILTVRRVVRHRIEEVLISRAPEHEPEGPMPRPPEREPE